MKASPRNYNALILTVALLIFILGMANLAWFFSAGSRGQQAARAELASGHYVMLDLGLQTPERYEVARLLQEKHGIELRFLGQRRISRTMTAYVKGYNQVVASAAGAKFGHDFYKECVVQAHQAMRDSFR